MKWKDILRASQRGGQEWDSFVESSKTSAIKFLDAIATSDGVDCAKEAMTANQIITKSMKKCEMCIMCAHVEEKLVSMKFYNSKQMSVKSHENICSDCNKVVRAFCLLGNACTWVKSITTDWLESNINTGGTKRRKTNGKSLVADDETIERMVKDKSLLEREHSYLESHLILDLFSGC